MTIALNQDRLTLIFSALANETRRAILNRLSNGEATVNELAEPFDMSLPAISKHVKVLERAGLVSQGKQAQYRPCKMNAEPLQELDAWTQQYRLIWEERFDQMDSYLQELQTDTTKRNSNDK